MNKNTNINKSQRLYFAQSWIGIVIIAVAVIVSFLLYFSKPTAEKTVPRIKASLVETMEVKRRDKPLVISAFGTVQPHRNLTVQAEVKGRIIQQSPNLDAGGILKKDEILLKLDPRDYIVDLEQSRAKVEKAEFDLIVEKGKKLIAEREWALLDTSLKQGGIGKNLALRIPHLREKEAALHAAQSSLEKSMVDLKRTLLRAPFNSLVLEEFVEVGQLILPQTKVATLVSTDEFRVQVSIPYEQLALVEVPVSGSSEKTPVTIIQDLGNEHKIKREGYVLRILGDLNPNGRMVQLLIVIDDPLDLKVKNTQKIPLLLGTYVEVQFLGPELENTFELSRKAIHEQNRIWIKSKDNKLEIRQVEILAGDKEVVTVRGGGLSEGDRVIISSLPAAIPGMDLREFSDAYQNNNGK